MTLPDAPVFLAQQGYTGRKLLAPVAAARVSAKRRPPGLLLDFGAVHLRGVRDDHGKRGQLMPVLADSARYDLDRKPPMASWVEGPAPNNRATWDAAIRDSLAEQRNLNVDALSVPGVELSTSGYPNGLQLQTDAIRRAWRDHVSTDPPWFARFSVHDDWLTDATLRRAALNTLTDLPDGVGISLHVRYGKRAAGFDGPSLTALRDFVRVLADDGRRVLLIQSGIIGWLAIAWGAWGFTAGQSQKSWLDSREEIRRRRGSRSPARLQRYFEPQLLHHVLFADHGRLRRATGYAACSCTFCKDLKTSFNAHAAAQHDLFTLAELTQRVTASDRAGRRDAVRLIVEEAQKNWANWQGSASLNTRSKPTQLATWRALV